MSAIGDGLVRPRRSGNPREESKFPFFSMKRPKTMRFYLDSSEKYVGLMKL